jgi:hypothetical protein
MKTNHKPQSILYPQPVLVIASYDKEGKADAIVTLSAPFGHLPLEGKAIKLWKSLAT